MTSTEKAPTNIDATAMFTLSYGLYALITKDGEKDNACILNTVMQVTEKPLRIFLAVNKSNYSCELMKKTGVANLSVLSKSAPFSLFQRFGFQSGRDHDKFEGLPESRTDNGLRQLDENVCATIALSVVQAIDLGTHTAFLCDVTTAKRLQGETPMTYADYHQSVKPKPQHPQEKKMGFVCTVCGYVHEGETLPDGFICPICKHGVDAFVPLT